MKSNKYHVEITQISLNTFSSLKYVYLAVQIDTELRNDIEMLATFQKQNVKHKETQPRLKSQ